MNRAKTQQRVRWQLSVPWAFEAARDGTILFFPHGWGQAYAVPTEDKRREIESFLMLWLARLQTVMHVSRWLALTLMIVFTALLFPPVCRLVVWYVPGRGDFAFGSALIVGGVGCLLLVACPVALRFAAETAKAELEKAQARRSLAEFLREHSRISDWYQLWMAEILYALCLLEGLRWLSPRRETIMLPARVNSHSLAVGVALIVLGGVGSLVKLWQIRVKLQT